MSWCNAIKTSVARGMFFCFFFFSCGEQPKEWHSTHFVCSFMPRDLLAFEARSLKSVSKVALIAASEQKEGLFSLRLFVLFSR